MVSCRVSIQAQITDVFHQKSGASSGLDFSLDDQDFANLEVDIDEFVTQKGRYYTEFNY